MAPLVFQHLSTGLHAVMPSVKFSSTELSVVVAVCAGLLAQMASALWIA